MAALRSRSFLVVAAILLLLLVLAGGAVAYDGARKDRIADGVTVGGVRIGGLSTERAREKLRADLAGPLRRDVVARYGDVRFTLTPKTSGIAVDVDASVEQALERSRRGNIVTRTVRGLTGGGVDARLDPAVTYDADGIDTVVERAQDRLDQEPRDAKVDFSGGTLEVATGRDGRAVRAEDLRRALTAELIAPSANDTVRIEMRRSRPKVGTARLADRYPTMMAVDRSNFTLTLYKHLEKVKTYSVAVGQIGLDTPAGEYKIQNKAVDPSWNVPTSAWAGSLGGTVVPPGPSNPLKARWMGIFDGAGIHGTDDVGSLGSAASHGCVRMAVSDVIDLYDRVKVGTPIYIA